MFGSKEQTHLISRISTSKGVKLGDEFGVLNITPFSVTNCNKTRDISVIRMKIKKLWSFRAVPKIEMTVSKVGFEVSFRFRY